jgi:hypothetical protein
MAPVETTGAKVENEGKRKFILRNSIYMFPNGNFLNGTVSMQLPL